MLQDSVSFQLVLEEDSDSGRLIAKGKFGSVDIATANKRIYPKHIIEREIKRILRDAQERRLYGELDHPGDGKTKLSRASHLITDLQLQDDGTIIGKAEILNTRNGKELQAINEQGGKIGVSSRGYGSVKPNNEGYDIVQDDYTLMTYDFVADPAASGSYPEFASETPVAPAVKESKKDEQTSAVEETPAPAPAAAPLQEGIITKDMEEMKKEHQAQMEALKEQFKAEMSDKLATLSESIRAEMTDKLMGDPSVAGAKQALESVKTMLRPYILEADVNEELSLKDKKIGSLKEQIKALEDKSGVLESKLNEFASVTKELGFKLFLERIIAVHPKRDAIIEKIGDVNVFPNIEALKHRVNILLSEYKQTDDKVKAIKESQDAQVSSLREEVASLRDQLSNSLEVGKNFGIQAYLHKRVLNHPKASQILEDSRFVTLETKEDVDTLISEYRVVKRDVHNGDYKTRIRKFFRTEGVVEQSLEGTRLSDKQNKVQGQMMEGNDPVKEATGNMTMEEVNRLARV